MVATRNSRFPGRWIAAAVVAWGAIGAAGCYERVVAAKGIGTSGVTVYEPNVPDQGADDRRLTTPLNRSKP